MAKSVWRCCTTEGLDLVEFDEKPIHRCYVNAGIYVLQPHALNLLQAGKSCNAPDLLMAIKAAGEEVKVFVMHEHWLDIGRQMISQKQKMLLTPSENLQISLKEIF